MSQLVKAAVREFPEKEYLKEDKVLRRFRSYLHQKYGIENTIDTHKHPSRFERFIDRLNYKITHKRPQYDTQRPTEVRLFIDRESPISDEELWNILKQVKYQFKFYRGLTVQENQGSVEKSLFIPDSVLQSLTKYIKSKGGKLKMERQYTLNRTYTPSTILEDAERKYGKSVAARMYNEGVKICGDIEETFEIKLPGRSSKLTVRVISRRWKQFHPEDSNNKVRYFIHTPTDIGNETLMDTLDYLIKTVNELSPTNGESEKSNPIVG